MKTWGGKNNLKIVNNRDEKFAFWVGKKKE